MNLLSPCDLLSRRTLCRHPFPGNSRHFPSQRRVPGIVNLGGIVKTPRHRNFTIFAIVVVFQENSRRLWRSRRRKSSSVPEGRADLPAAIFLAGKCPNLGRDSISRCRKIRESFSSSVEICRKTLPATNFGQPQPFRVF